VRAVQEIRDYNPLQIIKFTDDYIKKYDFVSRKNAQ